jgi:hypothetical protein
MPASIPWADRVWREFRAGNLTRSWRDVLLTLATFRGHGGSIHPSHATLAERGRCSVRTVQRALAHGQRLGLVEWSERRVRASWRWLRTSNAYRLLLPPDPVRACLRPFWRRFATTGQTGAEGERRSKKEAHERLVPVSLETREAAQRALVAVRERRMTVLGLA